MVSNDPYTRLDRIRRLGNLQRPVVSGGRKSKDRK